MTWLARLQDYDDPASVGSRLRARRVQRLKRLIARCRARSGGCKILDLGGTPSYWTIFDDRFLSENRVEVTLLNLQPASVGREGFSSIVGDACDLSAFADKSVDLVHANSVIEHLGDAGRMDRFAREVKRVGKDHWVQTPYFWFPIDPHFGAPFFHWLPKSARIAWLTRSGLGWIQRCADADEARRVLARNRSLRWNEFRALFPESHVFFERFLSLPKSIIATTIGPDGGTDPGSAGA